MERLIETLIARSRWLLAPIWLALAIFLLFLAIVFVKDLIVIAPTLLALSQEDAILATLSMIDLALVASLLVMVTVSGYETFVGRLETATEAERTAWIAALDGRGLAMKVVGFVIAISSVQLLKAFFQAAETPNDKLLWLVILHLTFVVSALIVALIGRYFTPRADGA